MKYVPPELNLHLSSGVTTVCHCWILTRKDGQRLGFTDHDRSLVIEGIACEATTGLQPSEAAEQLGLSVDIQEVDGVLHSTGISESDLREGRYDGAKVEIWLVNWQEPVQRMLQRTAILGEVNQTDSAFSAELRGLTTLLDQPIGRTYGRQCDVEVGSIKCGIDLMLPAYFLASTVVEMETELRIRCTGLATFEKDWFAGGTIQWVSGRNAGLSGQVSLGASTDNDGLTLWVPMPNIPEMGDEFTVTTGCDRSFATCKSKFANELNFRGCPHMPGRGFSLGYVQQTAVHNGSPLVD